MERMSKVMLLIIVAIVLASNVEGRMLKSKDDPVDHPQNFYGGAGGAYFPGTGPAIVRGIGFGPSGFCTLPGGNCVPTAGGFPTFPGGSTGSGGSVGHGSGSVPVVPSVPIVPHD